jgi:hypothetical protein
MRKGQLANMTIVAISGIGRFIMIVSQTMPSTSVSLVHADGKHQTNLCYVSSRVKLGGSGNFAVRLDSAE